MENNNNLSAEVDIRREKIKSLKNAGVIVYKDKFDRTHKISEARKLEDGARVRICGRMMFRRVMGNLALQI